MKVIMGRLTVLSRQVGKHYKWTVMEHPGKLAMAKHGIKVWHCGQHHSPCTCVYIYVCVILVLICLVLTHHFIVFLWFPSAVPFHALLFTPFSLRCMYFVPVCSTTTHPTGATRTLPWFTLLSCVFAVLGLFNCDDEGSIILQALVNYQTMWHRIPENYKLHSQWWTQVWTGWSLLSSPVNQHNLQVWVNKNLHESWGVSPLQNR